MDYTLVKKRDKYYLYDENGKIIIITRSKKVVQKIMDDR